MRGLSAIGQREAATAATAAKATSYTLCDRFPPMSANQARPHLVFAAAAWPDSTVTCRPASHGLGCPRCELGHSCRLAIAPRPLAAAGLPGGGRGGGAEGCGRGGAAAAAAAAYPGGGAEGCACNGRTSICHVGGSRHACSPPRLYCMLIDKNTHFIQPPRAPAKNVPEVGMAVPTHPA